MNNEELGDVESVELKLKLDATITVTSNGQPSEWIKPGVEGKIVWRRVPTESETVAGYVYIQEKMLQPMLEDLVVQYRNQLAEARRKG